MRYGAASVGTTSPTNLALLETGQEHHFGRTVHCQIPVRSYVIENAGATVIGPVDLDPIDLGAGTQSEMHGRRALAHPALARLHESGQDITAVEVHSDHRADRTRVGADHARANHHLTAGLRAADGTVHIKREALGPIEELGQHPGSRHRVDGRLQQILAAVTVEIGGDQARAYELIVESDRATHLDHRAAVAGVFEEPRTIRFVARGAVAIR